MKYKFIFLLLLIPELLCAQYPCRLRQPAGWWGSADYLFLWRKKRFYPPLLTTNPTELPVLTDPDTTILFGDEYVGGNPKSGIRLDAGIWLTCCLGIGGGLYALQEESVDYKIITGRDGFPILGRPIFNVSVDQNEAIPVSFPPLNIVDGFFDADTANRTWTGDVYARYRFLHTCGFKLDLIGGFMYSNVQDNLDINTRATAADVTELNISNDHFSCCNDYYAGLVGFITELRSCSWAVTFTGKVGLGNMVKKTAISGFTIVEDASGAILVDGNFGLLAQPSNSGEHAGMQFEVVPQIITSLQLKILPHIWFSAGYMYMFWPDVALAGEQLDLNINPTQNPPIGPPPIGPLAPLFNLKNKSFWVQGITAGIYVLY